MLAPGTGIAVGGWGGDGRRLMIMPAAGARFTAAQKAVLAGEILTAYVRVRRQMARGDLRRAVAELRQRPAQVAPPAPIDQADLWSISWQLASAVRGVLRPLPFESRCLAQSLVLCQLMSSRALPFTLVIGARSEPEFAAHAWVEQEGRPVLPAHEFSTCRLLEL